MISCWGWKSCRNLPTCDQLFGMEELSIGAHPHLVNHCRLEVHEDGPEQEGLRIGLQSHSGSALKPSFTWPWNYMYMMILTALNGLFS